ncbi:hypothetical protein C6Y11_05410 [Lactiplantibacillus pentosus]|jgi:hypothetical protein|uniref:hypothetical protein n=1 Tax=Lactiplantibacillus pentosus TaxID=1589 RepID=UPI000D020BC1|nr:hypothetical protein [Lactiplantibacillus pentosus]MBO9165246.1 hypothetical protein [Lactiplantibacillus pentosus]MCT3302512.1 hypothetical protein [Lactiplantibacillus pentosus]MCT3309220.1 hypothetical protein [Lactiplantibacillus pentosus]PRO79902.1 hypothetical protein C6Y09_12165 [Lactiplantibacillus pentosus]PRO80383.1 hypothetical protein C6Y11_05410 [Lactiplantibacillus pentosus]
MGIHEFDNVTVVHGRVAAIVEVLDNSLFFAAVGINPSDWNTIQIQLEDIKGITCRAKRALDCPVLIRHIQFDPSVSLKCSN